MKAQKENARRKEAQICIKDWCTKVYDGNAELINGLTAMTAFIIFLTVVIKSLKS